MIRFLVIFVVALVLALSVMSGLLARNGYSVFDPQMAGMLALCFAVALYVSWRISNVLRRRQQRQQDSYELTGQRAPTQAGMFGSLFGGKSRAQLEREARFEAKKRRLIQDGKVAAEAVDEAPPADVAEAPGPEEVPARVSASASVKDKMAARRERVRRAREEGKI